MKNIILKGVIGLDVTAEDIRKELPAGSEKITLLINSPGGDIFEAFEIYNLLKEYKGKVTARVTGLAASAAADIFFGADEREWHTHSAVMYHRAWTFTYGNAEELRKEAEILDSLDKIRITDYAKVAGKSLETAMAEFTDETWLIGDEKIRAAGISGTLVDGDEDAENINNVQARQAVAEAVKRIKAVRAERNPLTFYISGEELAARVRALITDATAQADVNKTEGAYMEDQKKATLEEENEELKEEIKELKEKLNEKDEEAKKSKKAESDRILGILALAGVQYPDDIKLAIANGITPEAYAVGALTKQREAEAKLKAENNIQPGTVPQSLAEQTGKQPEGKPADIVTEDDISKFARARTGRR